METENNTSSPEKKEKIPSIDTVIVAPGFESDAHRSGLHWDTRLRLLAASMCYENDKTQKIIVCGARIRNMQDSFANLMKNELMRKYNIPESAIETEENTFDTPSQINWAKQHEEQLNNAAFITDPEQMKHIHTLLGNYKLPMLVLSTEDIIIQLAQNSRHFQSFFKRLHRSPYWLKWKGREWLLTLITKTIDKKGERLQALTKGRLNTNSSTIS